MAELDSGFEVNNKPSEISGESPVEFVADKNYLQTVRDSESQNASVVQNMGVLPQLDVLESNEDGLVGSPAQEGEDKPAPVIKDSEDPELARIFIDTFDRMDTDEGSEGEITRAELDRAVTDPSYTGQSAPLLASLKKNFDNVSR